MSKDAWIGQDEEGRWFGGHDGWCDENTTPDELNTATHRGTTYSLSEVIVGIEKCVGQALAWSFQQRDNGDLRLIGYVARQ